MFLGVKHRDRWREHWLGHLARHARAGRAPGKRTLFGPLPYLNLVWGGSDALGQPLGPAQHSHGTWGERHPHTAWPTIAGDWGNPGLTYPRGPTCP